MNTGKLRYATIHTHHCHSFITKHVNNLKRTFTFTMEDLIYIENYQRIYKRVLREAKKRENDRYVIQSMDRMKAIWRQINREIGKAPENEQKLELRIGNKLISNPTEITDKLNTNLISTVEELVKQKAMEVFMI